LCTHFSPCTGPLTIFQRNWPQVPGTLQALGLNPPLLPVSRTFFSPDAWVAWHHLMQSQGRNFLETGQRPVLPDPKSPSLPQLTNFTATWRPFMATKLYNTATFTAT
jgi:hypothetical protein